jgi:hypothetical protein
MRERREIRAPDARGELCCDDANRDERRSCHSITVNVPQVKCLLQRYSLLIGMEEQDHEIS